MSVLVFAPCCRRWRHPFALAGAGPCAKAGLRPDQLCAERADGRARAAADQQRDPEPAKPDNHAAQPGEESGEPAVFLADAIDQSITQTQQLLTQAQRIAYDVNQIDQAFTQTYPQSYGARPRPSSSSATRRPAGRMRSPDSRTLRVQAGVVQALGTTRTQIDALVSSSQSATGILQAAQAGNQLVALQTTSSSTSPR